MGDEFRVRVTLSGEGTVHRLLEHLKDDDVADAARRELPAGAIVSDDDPDLFVYAGDRDDLAAAVAIVERIADQRGLDRTETAPERWHPIEERWEPADAPLPQTEEEVRREREALRDDERAARGPGGIAEWEIDVVLESRADAVALAERLQDEGVAHSRTAHYLQLPAPSEDDARELAERIGPWLPAGARVSGPVGSEALAFARTHPFAFLGGLAN